LQRQEYAVFNEPVSKEEFEKKRAEIFSSIESYESAQRTWQELRERRARRPLNISNSENCFGDFITNSKNCIGCYDITECQDCCNMFVGIDNKDSLDCSNVYLKMELCYNVLGSATAYHSAFCLYIFHSSNILYSEYIYDSKNIFGCVGLKNANFCIFNKQFSESDYEIQSQKIVAHMKETGEWGEMFPEKLSPFGYNESIASDFYPMSRDEVLKKGWLWRDIEKKEQPPITKKSPPEDIHEASESTCKEVFSCLKTGEPYKIINQELQFLKKEGIPLPRFSPQFRHKRRESIRNPHVFIKAKCSRCEILVVTNSNEETHHNLYCEDCFQKEFFS
jgi:hypothetical protein